MTPVRVLVIEHNEVFLRLLTRFMREAYADQVLVAGILRGDEQALMQFRRLPQQVILLDVDALNSECPKIIRRLRQLFANVRIVAMASPAGDSMVYPRQAALAAGADGFISKGDLGTELMPLLRAASGAE